MLVLVCGEVKGKTCSEGGRCSQVGGLHKEEGKAVFEYVVYLWSARISDVAHSSRRIREDTKATSSCFKTTGSSAMVALSILGFNTHTSGDLLARISTNQPGGNVTGRIGDRLPVRSNADRN